MTTLTVAYASELGAILDCDVLTGEKIGGGTPTNNDQYLNPWLAQATATAPRKLIIDGGTATNGLLIPTTGNVTIEFPTQGCGLFVLSGSNNPPITNAPVTGIPSNGNRLGTLFANQSASGANITIRGGTINGNVGTTYPATNSSYSDDPKNNIYGIALFNVAGVTIERCIFINVPSFNIWMYGCSDVIVDGNHITSTGLLQDGIHFSGPNSTLRVTNNYISTGDDSIALNSPENQYVSASGGGAINDVSIYGNTVSGNDIMRAYGNGSTASVGRVVAQGNKGVCGAYVYLLGNGVTAADALETIVLSDAICEANEFGFVGIADYCGDVELANHIWDSPATATTVALFMNAAGGVLSSFTFTNFKIYRTSRGHAAAYGVACEAAGQTIQRLVLNGFAVINEAGESYSAIPYLIDMNGLSITELVINSLDPTNITALVNPTTGFTGIGSISGPGVLATGFQIPDSAMANNCPYISATSPNAGKPCIKIADIVNVYTTTT